MDERNEIEILKKEKDFVILAHYYVEGRVQETADYVGDSFFLAKVAEKVENRNILFAGVRFMGESAKLLNPEKHVYMAEPEADCPMAHMVRKEDIVKVREEKKDVAVVCYVNSTAEIKALSDVCVTSSNALKVVRNLNEKYIFFIPDNNLAHFIAEQCPEKEFIYNEGYCPVHKHMTAELIKRAKNEHPLALVLAHPECTGDALCLADFIGSTSQIIDFATESDKEEFIIATEMGILYELEEKNSGKKFWQVSENQICMDMKKVTIEKIRDIMKNPEGEILLPKDIMEDAKRPLKRMLELAK